MKIFGGCFGVIVNIIMCCIVEADVIFIIISSFIAFIAGYLIGGAVDKICKGLFK